MTDIFDLFGDESLKCSACSKVYSSRNKSTACPKCKRKACQLCVVHKAEVHGQYRNVCKLCNALKPLDEPMSDLFEDASLFDVGIVAAKSGHSPSLGHRDVFENESGNNNDNNDDDDDDYDYDDGGDDRGDDDGDGDGLSSIVGKRADANDGAAAAEEEEEENPFSFFKSAKKKSSSSIVGGNSKKTRRTRRTAAAALDDGSGAAVGARRRPRPSGANGLFSFEATTANDSGGGDAIQLPLPQQSPVPRRHRLPDVKAHSGDDDDDDESDDEEEEDDVFTDDDDDDDEKLPFAARKSTGNAALVEMAQQIAKLTEQLDEANRNGQRVQEIAKRERAERQAAERRLEAIKQRVLQHRQKEAQEAKAMEQMLHKVEENLVNSRARAQTAEAQVVDLQVQVARLSEQVAHERRRAAATPPPSSSSAASFDNERLEAARQVGHAVSQRLGTAQADFEKAMSILVAHKNTFRDLAQIMSSLGHCSNVD
jgi:hypothetical protein